MLITGQITEQQMFDNGLSRMFITGEIGIPEMTESVGNPTWKKLIDLTEDDFNRIELFFNLKKWRESKRIDEILFCDSCGTVKRNCIC